MGCGGAVPNEASSNVFTYVRDEVYIDELSKKPADKYQTPVDFLARMLDLFTSPDDWVLDGQCKSGMFNNNLLHMSVSKFPEMYSYLAG